MSEVVERIELAGNKATYREDDSPRYPVLKGTRTLCHRYLVGASEAVIAGTADFESGDNLRLDLDGAQKILFAVAKTPSGTLLTIAETDLATETNDAARQGISLTFGVSTTDVEV